tara:strand:- start:1143 stop:1361 length:219 start_codon:yes stop_codon:yes gene_type:complete
MKHSITIRIDEHLKEALNEVSERTNQRTLSNLVRDLLQSSIDHWKTLDDKEIMDEVRRINSDKWDRTYDSNQ